VDRWLYQGLAEPPPAATLPAETITLDKWFRQASEPVRAPVPCPESPVVQPIDPSLYPIPGDGAWLQPIAQPVLPREAVQPPGGVYVADPTTFVVETITLDKWFQQASEPVRTVPPRLPGYWAGVLEPTLFTVPPMDTWWRPASEPTRRIPPCSVGDSETISEPTLFEVPGLDMWYRPLSEPVLPWPPRPHGGCTYQGDPDDFVAVVAGPYEVVAADSYSAGARAAGVYRPGAVEADNYQAGAVAGDAEPM
jgi:hypothetical protein